MTQKPETFISQFGTGAARQMAQFCADFIRDTGIAFDWDNLTDFDAETGAIMEEFRAELGVGEYRSVARSVIQHWADLGKPSDFCAATLEEVEPEIGEPDVFDQDFEVTPDELASIDPLAGLSPAEATEVLALITNLRDGKLEPVTDDLTEDEQEQREAYQQSQLRAVSGEVADARRNWRREYLNSGLDIVDFAASVGAETPEDKEYVARMCGFTQATWDEPRNITRRKKLVDAAVKRAGQGDELARQARARRDATTQAEPQKAAPAKLAAHAAKPQGEKSGTPESYQGQAQAFYASLALEYPARAAKLARSLDFQISQFNATIERYTGKGKSFDEAATIWLRAAEAAARAKVN